MIWFTADEHYGHKNIIDFVGRPFESLEEMNEEIIKRHNTVVAQGDLVYHLGDVTFNGYPERFVDQLNGQHYLIKGNHDSRKLRKNPGPYVWVKDVETVKWEDHRFFLSHFAHRVWPRGHYGVYHLYGHSHGTLPPVVPGNRSMDVGVDTNDYYPISAALVVETLKSVIPEQVDHHAIAFKDVL